MPYVEESLDELKKNDTNINVQPIPRHYLKVGIFILNRKILGLYYKNGDRYTNMYLIFYFQSEMRFNKLVPSEDEVVINRTGLPGLESTVPNSYCNAMLQVLIY